MEFNFNCMQILGSNQDGYAILEGSFQSAIKPGYIPYVNEIIDSMGYASSTAQGLKTIITSGSKFFSSHHRIFIKAQDNKVIGFIKVGDKKLFVRDEMANYHEITPLCVLDFYVHESQQRAGHGKSIFEYMLNFEKAHPTSLAYDRPSSKLLSFLSKQYNLTNYIPQNNNYVVFKEYFQFNKLDKNQMRNYNYKENYSNNPSNNNLASLGQQLIGINNNSANPINYNNSKSLTTPNKNFANYYLNAENTNYYDNIYSKKKLNLLNDYLSSNKKEPYEYVRENEIHESKDRAKQLESNINNNYITNDYYNKRNDYYTVFDDKKTLDKKIQSRHTNFANQSKYSPIAQIPYNLNNLPVKTNILPTTSLSYGAYYNTNNKNTYYY